ncbi:hypothetical protein [Geoalkalibacter halelectricus]|uniref:hypothetical protein n=1 Tax=Geoalkalibacter halelectricus TaxID=2847045 RepID=UPI00267023C8|nr:hypothetical protein [Geoalkalibacter halelectricus]MDO3377388.1 hypothetical protein [Geoalkalibacter halelectricus]
MFEQIFQSVGEVTQVYTLVDFYTYIKGMEYLICVGFFIGFHSFYKFVINPEEKRDSIR